MTNEMTNQEILTKAVKKAIAGGWNTEVTGMSLISHTEGYYLTTGDQEFDFVELYPLIIFNHDFAKALWGDTGIGATIPYEAFITEEGKQFHIKRPLWKIHLSRMVIADDPIQYLKENT